MDCLSFEDFTGSVHVLQKAPPPLSRVSPWRRARASWGSQPLRTGAGTAGRKGPGSSRRGGPKRGTVVGTSPRHTFRVTNRTGPCAEGASPCFAARPARVGRR